MWRFNKRIIITNIIIGYRIANRGRVILCIEWNALRLWNRIFPLYNALILAVSLLAKFILLLLTSTLTKPDIIHRWRAVD